MTLIILTHPMFFHLLKLPFKMGKRNLFNIFRIDRLPDSVTIEPTVVKNAHSVLESVNPDELVRVYGEPMSSIKDDIACLNLNDGPQASNTVPCCFQCN